MNCDFCKKLISRKDNRKTMHRNMSTQNKLFIFCSKQCYHHWLKEIQEKNAYNYFIWSIRTHLEKVYFDRNKVKVEGFSHIYGSNIENSHFSKILSITNKNKEIKVKDNN